MQVMPVAHGNAGHIILDAQLTMFSAWATSQLGC